MTIPSSSSITRPAGPSGGLFGVRNLLDFQSDTLGFLTRTAQGYGDLVYFRMAAFHFYLVNHPDLVHEVLIKNSTKVQKWKRQTDTWANAVGASTLTLEGDTWKKHRRLLNPAFHSQTVKRYYDVIIEHTQRLLDGWEDGESYEMMFEMMRTTMGIIADIIFSLKDMQREAADLNQALTAVFEVLTKRTTAFQQLPPWLPTPDNLRIQQATRTIEGFVMSLIRKRRQDPGEYADILSDLIQAKDEETGATLTDLEINYELKTLFGAGHETTALMLMWTLYLLSLNPEIQDRLREEVDTVLGEWAPALEDLPRMPYTLQVLNESMRIYPPAWSLMVRRAMEDISLGGTSVPAGSVMLIPMWVIHRDARFFEEPLKFDPERFAGDWKKRYPSYSYFPFGGGGHVCIGSHLAMLEGQLILPMMVQRYRFEVENMVEPQLQALLTLRPKGGLRMRVRARE
jgi:cytochrome P450